MKKKPVLITIAAIVAVSLVLYGIKGFGIYQMIQFYSTQVPPPITVSATHAKQQSWQPRIEAVGSLTAVQGVNIASEVAGKVEKILFESGQTVEKDALLVQLDDSAEQAQLPGARAQAKLARANLERAERLIEQKLVSEEQLDNAQSQLQQAESALASLQATIAKKAIHAPFAGTLGIREVDLGQYLAAGTQIVTLQALDALYVDFTLPEQFLQRIAAGQTVEVTTATYPDKTFTGVISAVGVKLDPSTHNFDVRAALENPEHLLRPGMFANAAVLAGEPVDVVTVPKVAITYSLYGDSVYLIKEEIPEGTTDAVLKAEQVFVRTGESHGADVAILEGVKLGDRIVTAGQIKLRSGATVAINNSVPLDGTDDAAGELAGSTNH